MATVTIPALPSTSTVNDDDLIVIDQSGTTYKIPHSVLVGSANNTITGSGSYFAAVFGYYNTASLQWNSTVGIYNTASSNYNNSAIGYSNNATGGNSSALGYENTASGETSTAVGSNNTASNNYAVAIGHNNLANGYNSVAVGAGCQATDEHALSVGGSGFSGNLADGEYTAAIGYDNQILSDRGTGVGNFNSVSDYGATALGSNNTASGYYAIAAGYDNSATSSGAVCFGSYNTASGYYANAIGNRNTASNDNASAVGARNTASGDISIAFGYNNTTSDYYSAAFGAVNTVRATYSIAVGLRNNIISQNQSNSVAVGQYNTGAGSYGTAVGQYNINGSRWSSTFGNSNFTGHVNWEENLYNINSVDSAFVLTAHDPDEYLFQSLQTYNNYNGLALIQIVESSGNNAVYTVGGVSPLGGGITQIQVSGLSSPANDGAVIAGGQLFDLTFDFPTIIDYDSGHVIVSGDQTWITQHLTADISIYVRATDDNISIFSILSASYDETNTTITINGTFGSAPTGYLEILSPIYWQNDQQNRFPRTSNVADIDQGGRTFSLSDDHLDEAMMGYIRVTESTGNDGVYNIVGVTYDGSHTIFQVAQAIPDPTPDGLMQFGQDIARMFWAPSTIGNDNQTTGLYSFTAGNSNTNSGYYATAIGLYNTVSNYAGLAVGSQNTVSGEYGSAIGFRNSASGYDSVAAGYGCSASAMYASAFGARSSGEEIESTAIGYQDYATAPSSTAVGFENIASGEGATACGYSNSASVYQACVFGAYNQANGEEKNTAIGWGNTVQDRHCSAVGFSNTTNGNYCNAFGYENHVTAFNGSAFGCNNTVSADYTTAIGFQNTASDDYAVAFGTGNTASGVYSSAFGINNTASNHYTTAAGYENTANENRASALGYNNLASGFQSLAVGASNIASSYKSIAVGSNNTSSAYYAMTVGNNNTSSGAYNNIFGVYNYIPGSSCSVFGTYNGTKNSDTYQGIAFGNKNTIDTAAIAIGTFNSSLGLRSNAIGNYNFANTNNAQAIGDQNFAGFVNWDENTYTVTNSDSQSSPQNPSATISISDSDGVAYTMLYTRSLGGVGSFIRVTDSDGIDGVYLVSGVSPSGSITTITINGLLPDNTNNTNGTVQTGTDLVDMQLSFSLAAILGGSGGAGGYIVSGDASIIQNLVDAGISVYFYANGGEFSIFPVSGVTFDSESGNSTIHTTLTVTGPGAVGSVRFASQVAWNAESCSDSFITQDIAGLATNQIIVVSGDNRSYFANCDYIWLNDDTNDPNNNGIYNVVAVGYDGTYTRITITEILTNPSESTNYGTLLAGSLVTNAFIKPVAVGQQNISTGRNSSTFGVHNYAAEISTAAFGNYNSAMSCYSSAFGAYNEATGNGSTAVGLDNTASGNFSIAIGDNNNATGENTIAIGNTNTAADYRTVAIGYSCSSSYYQSVAIGYGTNASGPWAVSIGQANTSSGGWATAIGSLNTASGEYATASGYNNTASDLYTVTLGSSNEASDNYAIAIGYGNIANQQRASAFGYQNTASGDHTSAFGYQNQASSDRDSAFGYGNTASGGYSTALGYGNSASGGYSTALGYGGSASGVYSTAIGGNAVARIDHTTNIGGAIIIRKDNDESDVYEVQNFAGAENIIMSKVVDLTNTVAISINLPTNSSFFPDECGLIITHAVDVTSQLTIKFGDEAAFDDLVSAVQTTGLIAFNNRQRFTSLSNSNGHTSLRASITVGATATNFTGRFYWKGMLVEDTVVEIPFYTNDGGSYTSPISNLRIFNDYPRNCIFYYTTDGSTPDTSSTYYTGGFDVYTSQTITALAVSTRGQWAEIGGGQVYDMTVAEPQFDVPGDSYDSPQTVIITCSTGPATIYYTTDGSDPTTGSTAFDTSVAIDVSTTLKAFAVLAGANDSPIRTAVYVLFCDNPGFSIGTGTYNVEESLTLTSNQPIYYTTDGSSPDSGSTLYTGPIDINASQTIKAISIQVGWTDSSIISNTYTMVCDDPGFIPAAGDGNNDRSVILVSGSSTPVYYTTDGSDPDGDSTLYIGEINITETDTTIKAISIQDGWTSSSIVSSTYTLTCATPMLSPGSGSYSDTQTVTISTSTTDADIYYTLDGSDPTTGSTLYSDPVDITVSERLKAIAHKSNYANSLIGFADYVIGDVLPTVTTDSLTSHFNGTVTANGTVSDDGSSILTDYGFVWNTSGSPTLSDNVVSIGSGSFTGSYSQLVSVGFTGVYFVAYATNSSGTTYGSVDSVYAGPCLIKGTKVTLADRTTKNIEDVTYDDKLLVWNFDEGKLDSATPVWMVIPWHAPEYALVKFSDGSELGTVNDGKGHRIFNMEKKEFTHLMNEDSPLGATTFNEKGETIRIISREVVSEPTTFYNIITNKHINVFANSILTSTGLNNIYPVENMKFVKKEMIVRWNKEEFAGIPDEIFNGFRLIEQPMNYPDLINKITRLVAKQI